MLKMNYWIQLVFEFNAISDKFFAGKVSDAVRAFGRNFKTAIGGRRLFPDGIYYIIVFCRRIKSIVIIDHRFVCKIGIG